MERFTTFQELVDYIYKESLKENKFKLYGDPGQRFDQAEEIAKDMFTDSKHPKWKLTNHND